MGKVAMVTVAMEEATTRTMAVAVATVVQTTTVAQTTMVMAMTTNQTPAITKGMEEGATMTIMIAGGATTLPKATTMVRTEALYLDPALPSSTYRNQVRTARFLDICGEQVLSASGVWKWDS